MKLGGGSIPDMSVFKNLQALDLSQNAFTGIHDTFAPLAGSLIYLNLRQNPFANIPFPSSILTLSKLRTLALDQTNIVGAMPDLEPLTSLDVCGIPGTACINYVNGDVFKRAQPAPCSSNTADGVFADLTAHNLYSLVSDENLHAPLPTFIFNTRRYLHNLRPLLHPLDLPTPDDQFIGLHR
ncbi:hypothetical protein HK101_005711 [Irineochytrium annulatum]|nr:hypothetical protein HK101_005711 [Irineochytrium annulatum]